MSVQEEKTLFLFRKISSHIQEHKFSYLVLLILVSLGFLAGCFYANLISDAEFTQAELQAEQFIREAKTNELSFRLMLSEELSPFLFIALFSLFLPGLFPIVFLLFKWGFSSGFILTFLVKCFVLKGFFLGGLFLFFHLVFFLPVLLLLSRQSIKLNRFILTAVFQRASHKHTVTEELLALAIATLSASVCVILGVTLKFLVLPALCNYLFL